MNTLQELKDKESNVIQGMYEVEKYIEYHFEELERLRKIKKAFEAVFNELSDNIKHLENEQND